MSRLPLALTLLVLTACSPPAPTDPTCGPEAQICHLQACARGYAGSCNALGLLYGHGRGVEVAPERAARFYTLACHGGDPQGCANLAWALDHGRGIEGNTRRARQLYREACDERVPMACAAVAEHLLEEGEPERANALLRRSCDADYGVACVHLGLRLDATGRDAASLEAYERACSLDVGAGCFNAALAYSEPKLRSQHFERACALDHLEGCHNLALALGEQESMRARVLYSQACEGGLGLSCFNLAVSYQEMGDASRASYFFRRACALGVEDGCEDE